MSMKIRNIAGHDGDTLPHKTIENQTDAAQRAVMFRRTLSGLGDEAQDARLTALVADIDKQGQKLSKKADVHELERYRAMIRQFMDEVVSNSYAFSKESTFTGRGSHRLMATVNTVNQKLDELAKKVLQDEAENIEILAMVDDIRGLLLDLML